MFIRKQKPALLYASSAPTRWLRTAAASLDEKLAQVCAKQWQSVPFQVDKLVDRTSAEWAL